MRRIAIIGAGQAGLYLGISLVDAGYTVTLFSDRAPEAILNGKPMATAFLFADALQLERNLGLNFWNERFEGCCDRFRNEICDADGNLALVVSSTLEKPWQGIDQRLKFFFWMQEFVCRGGELVIRAITLNDLEECTQNYDLVVVSAGRGWSTLFERDVQRSNHDKPKRHLASAIVTGLNPHSQFLG